MDAFGIVISIIGVAGTLSSILFAYLAFRKNDKKDSKESGKGEQVVLSDLGYIKSSINRIEKTIEKVEERNHELYTRVVKVEASASSAHKRIDEHVKNGHHSKVEVRKK